MFELQQCLRGILVPVLISWTTDCIWLDDVLSTPLFVGSNLFSTFRLQEEVDDTIVQEQEQSCVTVQTTLTEDQHATTQTAHGDTSKTYVCSFFFVWLHHTAVCNMEVGLNHCIVAGLLDYTTVQTVLSVVSNRTALASVGFMLVSYIGFSNDACPLELSWPT